jgi:hypothetical protein
VSPVILKFKPTLFCDTLHFKKKYSGLSRNEDYMKNSLFLSVSLWALMAANALAAITPVTPAGHPTMDQPAASSMVTSQQSEPLNGKVIETMNSGGYSYIFIEKKDGEKVWVSVPETQVKVGSHLSFKPGAEMGNFESKSLKRVFKNIIFSEGVLGAPAKTAVGNGQGSSPSIARTTTAKETKIAISKAAGSNASTIENLYINSSKLDKQKVSIKGKVVKVTSDIMGKNWIHLQDGTGSQDKGNYDLTCTTNEVLPKVGAIITVTGVVAKDRNFGAGYFYNVILEDAKFKKVKK